MSALVVDDDADLLASITRLADTAELRVATASSWDEGLLAFQALSPTVVIADYNMPGSRHGLRLLFEMARLRPSVRLVLMSAFLNDDDLQKVLAFEFVDAVFRKIDAVSTARAVLDEITAAAGRSDDATDWVALAESARSARNVSDDDIRRLDEFLRTNRLPSEQGQLDK